VRLWAAAIHFGDRSLRAEQALAECHLLLGDFARALPLLASAYSRSDKASEAALKLAQVYQRAGDLPRADAILAESLDRKWQADVALELAQVKFRGGRLADAEALVKHAIARDPTERRADLLLGRVHMRADRPRDALASFESALRLDPEDPEALCCAGEALGTLGDNDRAAAQFRKAMAVDPEFVSAYLDMGLLMALQGRYADALEWYGQAVKLAPERADAWQHVGSMQMRVGELQASVQSLERALSLSPHNAEILNSLGTVYAHSGQHSLAEAYFGRALAAAPEFHQARINRAFAMLTRGKYEEGFAEYEARLNMPANRGVVADAPWPVWNGEPLAGRKVVVRSEQGYGDSLQMIRFARQLAEQGASVLVETSAPLQRLLAHADGVAASVKHDDAKPEANFLCPMMSLPHRLGIRLETVPAQVPYIRVDNGDRERWRARLGAGNELKVGLAWASNPDNWTALLRGVKLQSLVDALQLDGVRLFSLQVGHGASQIMELAAPAAITDLTSELRDFYDTACLVANLDLVVSIDTAVAHLAGGLGIPVWVLLPHAPEWRWMLDREDSPWYPSAKLFRQRAPGQWHEVLERVRQEVTILRDASRQPRGGTASRA